MARGLSAATASQNNYFEVLGPITLKDMAAIDPPSHIPENLANVFTEGAVCLSVKCFNAGHAQGGLLPQTGEISTNRLMASPLLKGASANVLRQ